MLDVSNTLGYRDTMAALDNVFGVGKYTLSKLKTYDDEYEDFSFVVILNNGEEIRIAVAETQTEGMLHQGPGGTFGISVKSSESDFRGEHWQYLEKVVSPEEADFLNYEGGLGRDEKNIERSLQILKRYIGI